MAAIAEDKFEELCERGGVEAGPGDRAFLKGLRAEGILTEQNFARVLKLHRDASQADFDLAESQPTRGTSRDSAAGGSRHITTTAAGNEHDQERAEVLSRHVARLAAADLYVRMFRKTLLGCPTATLTPSRARRLLASQALRFLRWDDLHRYGVPLDGTHTSTVKSLGGGDGKRVREWVEVRITWPKHEVVWHAARTYAARECDIPGETVVAEPKSFLQGLAGRRGSSGHPIVTEWYGWSIADSAWFLLTGEPPAIQPLTVSGAHHFNVQSVPVQSWITIKALPDTSPDAIAEAFRREHLRVMGHRKGRPIVPRTLALVDFVEEQVTRHGPPDFEKLLKLWNKKHTEWKFRYPSKMKGAFSDAARRVFLLDIAREGPMEPDPVGALVRAISDLPDAHSFFIPSDPTSATDAGDDSEGPTIVRS